MIDWFTLVGLNDLTSFVDSENLGFLEWCYTYPLIIILMDTQQQTAQVITTLVSQVTYKCNVLIIDRKFPAPSRASSNWHLKMTDERERERERERDYHLTPVMCGLLG